MNYFPEKSVSDARVLQQLKTNFKWQNMNVFLNKNDHFKSACTQQVVALKKQNKNWRVSCIGHVKVSQLVPILSRFTRDNTRTYWKKEKRIHMATATIIRVWIGSLGFCPPLSLSYLFWKV